jgi:site-specific DNA-cytosine methylase
MEAASVAWHHLGWKPVGFSEIEPFPCAILKHHFTQPNYPYDVPNYGSLTEFQSWPLSTGDVDLLVGGTPCQAFSVAGKRGGLNDPRGQLMLSFLELAAKLQPRYVLWENVPGVLSSGQPKGSDFGCFIQGLVERGYGVAWRMLDAQFHGVPQRRRRIFVCATRDPVTGLGDWKAAAEILSLAEGLCGHLEKGKQTRKGSSSDAQGGVGADGLLPASATVTAKWAKGADAGMACDGSAANIIPQYWNGADVVNTLTRKGMDQLMPDKDNFQGVVVPNVAGTLDTECGGNRLTHQSIVSGHVIPTTPIVIDRAAFNQGENAQYEPRIGESQVMDTLVSKGPHAVGIPAMMFKVRGGVESNTGEQGGTPGKGAGKGFLGSEEKAFTIATSPDQWLAQPTAYSFDSLSSNSMKSPNPNSGCREVDLAKTLDTSNACPSKNQGGIGIVHPVIAPTVTTCKGSKGGSSSEAIDELIAMHEAQQAIPIDDGRAIEKNQNGLGVGKPGDPSYTLDTTGAQSVGQPLPIDFRNNKIFDDPNIAGTFQAKPNGGYSLNYTTGILETIAFRKSKRAQSTTDHETWVEAEASNTLNNFDLGDTRTTHAVIEPGVYENHAQDSRVTGPLDVAPTVAAKFGTGGGNVPLVQEGEAIAFDAYNQTASKVSQTVTCAASDANHVGTVLTPQVPMAVRRLTPVECERLQGFPDNWSRISWKGKPAEECPDGPRYKACGNSMAVPVMRFIGEAIAAYEAKRNQG